MKKLFILLLTLITLIGCTNNTQNQSNDTGCDTQESCDPSENKATREFIVKETTNMQEITMQEVIDKINNKETFIFFLTSNDCPWCIDAKPILDEVARDNDITVFTHEINLNDPTKDIRKNNDELFNTWKTLSETIFKDELEKVTIPFAITYINGISKSYFTELEYNAKEIEISNEDREILTSTYDLMIKEIISK